MIGIKREKSSENLAYMLLKFSLPLILSGVLQQLYNWVDAFIVGNVEGELALAAIGATGTVINFYILAITGFTLGLSILFAQNFGSGEIESISKILSTFSVLLGIMFILLAMIGIRLTSPLLRLMHTTHDTVHLAEKYLQIIFVGVPFIAVYNIYAAALRGIGDSKAPFLAILISSVVNIILDVILIAELRMGVVGAAVATVISQTVLTVFIVVYSIKKHSLLRFRIDRQSIDIKSLKQGVRLGFPPMIQSSVSALGSLILQNFMNGFGTQTVAAITTAYRVDSIVLLPVINLGSGISTIVAQSIGAGEEKRAKRIFGVGTAIMIVISLLLTVVVKGIGGYIIAIFGVGAEATEIGWNFFQKIAVFYLVYGLATSIRGYLEGLGDVIFSSIAGILALISRIIVSYSLAEVWGNMIIAYAEAFSWGVLLVLFIIRVIWKQKDGKRIAMKAV